MRFPIVLSVALTLLVAAAAHAQWGQRLSVGDSAPSLDIDEWVKGEAASIEDGKVYVVEFWATWCGPCRRAIPHLSELQRRYENEGLVIVGVSDEDAETVQNFVRREGDRIRYRIAVDRRNATKRSWHQAARQSGIPSVFIVDRQRRIQFIGNPLDEEFTRVLQQVLQGRFDARLSRDAAPIVQAAESARRVRNWRIAFQHLDRVIDLDKRVFAPYTLTKFEIMLLDMDDPERAYGYARGLLDSYADDALLLADLAEMITTDPRIDNDKRDLELAMEAARKAAAGDRNNPRVLSVQALVHFHTGDIDEAVSLQRRAWMIARPENKPGHHRVLRSYQDAAARAQRTAER